MHERMEKMRRNFQAKKWNLLNVCTVHVCVFTYVTAREQPNPRGKFFRTLHTFSVYFWDICYIRGIKFSFSLFEIFKIICDNQSFSFISILFYKNICFEISP